MEWQKVGHPSLIVNCRRVWPVLARALGPDPLPIQGSQPGAAVGIGW